MHLTSVYTLTNSLTHIQLDVVAFITFFQSVSILKPSVECLLCSFSVFFLVWSFCMPKKSLATHTFERGFFLHGKNMAPIKKAKQKTNKTANKKYFVVYIQRRMMESNDRLLQEKGTQITLRHTHTFIFLRMHAEVPAFIYPFRSRFRSFAHFMPTQPNKKTT